MAQTEVNLDTTEQENTAATKSDEVSSQIVQTSISSSNISADELEEGEIIDDDDSVQEEASTSSSDHQHKVERILYSSAKRIIPSLSESPSKRPRRSPSPPANIFTIKGCQWLLADSLNSYQPARREATNKYSISAIKCTDCDEWFLIKLIDRPDNESVLCERATLSHSLESKDNNKDDE